MKLIASFLFVAALSLLVFAADSAFVAYGGVGSETGATNLSSRRSAELEPGPATSILHVDNTNGDDNNDGLTPETAFATIQKAIDVAKDGDAVLVWPGVYCGSIDFRGKAITVVSTADPAVLEAPGGFAVLFAAGEGPCSVLRNFIIRNSRMAVFIAAASPTICNLTVVGNQYGIGAYGHCRPDISSSIFWDNAYGDLFQCKARYSRVTNLAACGGQTDGEGNIDFDPLFVDPNNADYHLLSRGGRYWPEQASWELDDVTSPCIDSGDPGADYYNEREPNGERINMGAYGGTAYASLSPPAGGAGRRAMSLPQGSRSLSDGSKKVNVQAKAGQEK
jgi:hypothetical protein